jgi:hypothetical protein
MMALNETLIAMQRQIASLQAEIERLAVQEAKALTAADLPVMPCFAVHRNGSNQSVAGNTFTTVAWTTEAEDSHGAFASNAFTVPAGGAGVYLFTVNTLWGDYVPVGTVLLLCLVKNSALYRVTRTYAVAIGAYVYTDVALTVRDRAAAGDAYSIQVYHTDSTARDLIGLAANTRWEGQWIST